MKKILLIITSILLFSVYSKAQDLNYYEIDKLGDYTGIHFIITENSEKVVQYYNNFDPTFKTTFYVNNTSTWEDENFNYLKFICTSSSGGNVNIILKQSKSIQFGIIIMEFPLQKKEYLVKLK